MPANHSEDKNANPDSSKLLASIKEWKEVIGIIAAALAVPLGRFVSGEWKQIVTSVLAALILGLGVLIYFKYKKGGHWQMKSDGRENCWKQSVE